MRKSEKLVQFSRAIPLRHEVDVFVAGGGPAGVAAALAAVETAGGRQNAPRVFLAEAESCFGGMGTAGLVPAFMQLTDGVNFLADGIGRRIYERLRQAASLPIDAPESSVSIPVEALKRVYDDRMQAAGVDFTFQTQVIGLEVEAGRVQHVICAAKSGIFAVKASVYVDATGDGDLAVWAGAPFQLGDEQGKMMPGTLCSLWADVDWEKVQGRDDRALEQAFAAGVFSVQDRHLPGMWRVGPHVAGGNVGHTFGVDGTDERSLTQALLWARRSLSEYERYYKEYLDGFEQMSLVVTGGLLGLRETRRILGEYELCLQDFKQRAVFEDEIGRYAYPVDIHASSPNPKDFARFEAEFAELRYRTGESYGIPYRTLTPKGLANVLVAGRCISTDRFLQGSVRVMPGCYITGQAAGAAAVLAVEQNCAVNALQVPELQRRLKRLGAFLPNFNE